MVGEQPGNEEDLRGEPFVGPAGRLLDRALADAAIHRAEVYVTNAVKHFKFEERGKRRLHKKPRLSEVQSCRPWLDSEIEAVAPEVIVCLGATAAQALLGAEFRITRDRGIVRAHASGARIVGTIHPSAILRISDAGERHAEYERLVDDLRAARGLT